MDLVWKIDKSDKHVKLKDYDPGYTSDQKSEADAKITLLKLGKELGELQELLWASQMHSILIVLQGMDTSGKDGTIRHVLEPVNPQGCYVHSFKAPTEEEQAHDFLWRVHNVAPARGMLGIFNRSHYEDVLIVRVHNLVPEEVWSKRYKTINNFELQLTEANTLVLKFFLHISKGEQEKRLLAREQTPDKAYKVATGDWIERKYWDDYQKAYEVALSQCGTDVAPWYIVAADHKWFRNLAIAHTLVHTMRPYREQWEKALKARGQRELALLQKLRETGKTA